MGSAGLTEVAEDVKVHIVTIGWDYEGEQVDSVWDHFQKAKARQEHLRRLRANGDISGDAFSIQSWTINKPETHL